MLAAALINPGDISLMTVPGYPVFGTHTLYYGGEVHPLALRPENRFLPDLNSIPQEVLTRAKALVLNYPNNPTGASATPEFFERVVAFAKQHRLVVIHDFAYAALMFEGKPLSFLATPGALDVGVELHSASKNFNMTGWRCGFVAGNRATGQSVRGRQGQHGFRPVPGGAECGGLRLRSSRNHRGNRGEILAPDGFCSSRCSKALASTWKSHAVLSSSTCHHHEGATGADGKVVSFASGQECSQWMITEHLISTVPWDDAGAYLRFSVTFQAPGGEIEERRVVGELKKRLSTFTYQW